MSTAQPIDGQGKLFGYAGLLLAIAGAAAIIVLGGNTAIAIGMLIPLLTTVVLVSLPATRGAPLAWLVTGIWTGAIGVITIFSVGIIFLIATVSLLAALLRASRQARGAVRVAPFRAVPLSSVSEPPTRDPPVSSSFNTRLI